MAERIGIVGLGLIGGSLLRALGDRAVGWDPSDDVRSEVTAAGFDVQPAEVVTAAELVVVAAPLLVSAEVVSGVLAAGGTSTVTDVASVKGPTIAAAGGDPRFVPGHPMAGTERYGWGASDGELFEGAPWLVLASDDTPPERAQAVRELATAVGARPVTIDPTVHDRVLARISHLPHVLAAVLTLLAEDDLGLAAGSLHGAARVATGDPALPTAMVTLNRDEVVAAVDLLIANLQRFRNDPDPAAWFERARDAWARR